VVCSVQPQYGRPSPWGEDDAWWRYPDQLSPYTGAVGFMVTRPTTPTRRRRWRWPPLSCTARARPSSRTPLA